VITYNYKKYNNYNIFFAQAIYFDHLGTYIEKMSNKRFSMKWMPWQDTAASPGMISMPRHDLLGFEPVTLSTSKYLKSCHFRRGAELIRCLGNSGHKPKHELSITRLYDLICIDRYCVCSMKEDTFVCRKRHLKVSYVKSQVISGGVSIWSKVFLPTFELSCLLTFSTRTREDRREKKNLFTF
jgi:hypothetical protein